MPTKAQVSLLVLVLMAGCGSDSNPSKNTPKPQLPEIGSADTVLDSANKPPREKVLNGSDEVAASATSEKIQTKASTVGLKDSHVFKNDSTKIPSGKESNANNHMSVAIKKRSDEQQHQDQERQQIHGNQADMGQSQKQMNVPQSRSNTQKTKLSESSEDSLIPSAQEVKYFESRLSYKIFSKMSEVKTGSDLYSKRELSQFGISEKETFAVLNGERHKLNEDFLKNLIGGMRSRFLEEKVDLKGESVFVKDYAGKAKQYLLQKAGRLVVYPIIHCLFAEDSWREDLRIFRTDNQWTVPLIDPIAYKPIVVESVWDMQVYEINPVIPESSEQSPIDLADIEYEIKNISKKTKMVIQMGSRDKTDKPLGKKEILENNKILLQHPALIEWQNQSGINSNIATCNYLSERQKYEEKRFNEILELMSGR